MKKAQLSTFIIIGMVILAVAGFSIYISQSFKLKELEEKSENIIERFKTDPLNNYINLCIKNKILDELLVLGRTGGHVIKPNTGLFQDTNIAIGEITSPDPPDYPQPNKKIKEIRYYPFGEKSFNPLCEINGPNHVSLVEFAYPCPAGSYGIGSIQKTMGDIGKRLVQNCIDEKYLREVTGFNVSVQDIKLTVIIGKEDVVVQASIPVEIKLSGYQPTKWVDFQQKIPVRLKRIYGLANYLIDKDRMNLDFNMSVDYDTEKYKSLDYDRYLSINVTPKKEGTTYGDVIKITDNASIVRGKPYEFFFARLNRNPVLEYIHEETYEINIEYDLLFEVGDTFKITPYAIDPDEDGLEIKFEGWKVNDGIPTTAKNNETISFRLEDTDIGTHELTVTVFDEHDLIDFQIVKIVVIKDTSGLGEKVNIDVDKEDDQWKITLKKGEDTEEIICESGETIDVCIARNRGQIGEFEQEIKEKAEEITGVARVSSAKSFFEVVKLLDNLSTSKGIEKITWNYITEQGLKTITEMGDINLIKNSIAKNDLFDFTSTQPCPTCKYEVTITNKTSCPDELDEDQTNLCIGAYQGACYAFSNETFEMVHEQGSRICNENLKQSFNEGKGYYDTQGAFECQATCNTGKCNWAVECTCKYGDSRCNGLDSKKLKEQGLITRVLKEGSGFCYSQCNFTNDLDKSPEACNIKYKYAEGNKKCCLDDVGEEIQPLNHVKYCIEPNECVVEDEEGTKIISSGGFSNDYKYFCDLNGNRKICNSNNKCKVITTKTSPLTQRFCKYEEGKWRWSSSEFSGIELMDFPSGQNYYANSKCP